MKIAPYKVHNLMDKRNLEDYPMVSMAKGTNAAFKLTRKSTDLQDFSSFYADVLTLLGHPTPAKA